ncbi:hypothetical protein [Archangium sp.]|jgi:hypothetical protein|uniref:hypothetical protein n=1 Tax=Archangium sp. TaxID=1872627 RepID=UPI002ED9022B
MRLPFGPRALLVSLLLAPPLVTAAPSFREQLDAYARERSLSVSWVSPAQLDEDPAQEHMARLCDPRAPSSSVYVLEQAPGVLWALDFEREQLPCPSPPPHAKPLPTRLKLFVTGTYQWWSASLAFREGRLVDVASGQGDNPLVHGTTGNLSLDWDRLIVGWSSGAPTPLAREQRSYDVESALVPVLATPEAAAALPPTFNHVLDGREQWKGEKDASMRVSALALGADTLRLRIHVRDDLPVPASETLSDPELLGVDHLVLQWNNDPRTQLWVARTGQGAPLVRWLQPAGPTRPLPTVALEGDTFLVDLPLSTLGGSPRSDSWKRLFSLVFSDSDTPGDRTQVSLSTGRNRSLAQLVHLPDSARYPPPTFVHARRLEPAPPPARAPTGAPPASRVPPRHE